MKLEKKVHAVNEVNRIFSLNFNHILPQLKTFVGQQIILKSGNKSAKFKNAISYLDEQPKGFGTDYARLHWCMLDINNYSVWLKISCSFKNDDVSCFYEETSMYIGEMQNGILISVVDEAPELQTYNVQGIRTMLELKKGLESQLSDLKSKLYKFDGFYS